jgi:PAS domain S-box-containing protein
MDQVGGEDLGLGWVFGRVREALVVVESASGRIVAANPAARELFGYETEELDVRLEDLVAERARAALATELAQRVLEEGSARVEVPPARTLGGLTQLELTASPADALSTGERRFLLVSIRDLSEQRRSRMRREALLRLARFASHGDPEELLTALLKEAVTVLDADDGGIAQWDAAREVLVQIRSLLPSSSAGVVIPLNGSLSGRAVRLGAPVIMNDYERWVGPATPAGRMGAKAVIAVPLRQEGRLLGTLSVSRFEEGKPFAPGDADVLELLASTVAATLVGLERSRKLEEAVEQLQRAKDAAEAGQRAESALLANMSHELRTPLNAIIGYSDLLLEETGEREQGAYLSDLRRIRAAGEHLLGLVEAVLELSDIEAGRLELSRERFDLEALARDVEATVRPLAETNHTSLDVDCRGELGWMWADLAKVRQVLLNLLGNAARSTERGTIRLVVSRHAGPEGDQVIFSVIDTGLGKTPDEQDKLFQVFAHSEASTSRPEGSTSLSLALSRRYCQLMGGDIEVESAPDRGSTLTVRFPAEAPGLGGSVALASKARSGGEEGAVAQDPGS